MNSSSEQNIVSDYYDNYKETQTYIFKSEARKTRNMIFWVAIILFAGDIIGLATMNAIFIRTILAALFFPVILIGLGLLAAKQPLIAIISSMIIFVIIIVLSFIVAGSMSLISGLIVKAVIVFCLLAGFNNAREAQRARKGM